MQFSHHGEPAYRRLQNTQSSIEEAAFPIIISAKKYTDEEVKRTLFALPGDVMAEIELLLSEYTKTGEYYVISSAGTRDLSELMKRICRLVSEKVRDDDN
ncbi:MULTISPECIES: hypothetical protein [unclassified Lysobacter]|uniref:hypothetical protein n=1 Tax=unclassified Lysobacter TaxID=2635362 RepID=UPI0012FC712F|nr:MULTISPECIES: hypothetical protein [unclassified Lysobacter]